MRIIFLIILLSSILVPVLHAQETLPYDFEDHSVYAAQNIQEAKNISDELYSKQCNDALNKITQIPTSTEDAFMEYSIRNFAPTDLKLNPKKAKANKMFVAQIYYQYKKRLRSAKSIINNPRTKSFCREQEEANSAKQDTAQNEMLSPSLMQCIASAECFSHINQKYQAMNKYIQDMAVPFYKKEKSEFMKKFSGEYYGEIELCRNEEKCSCPQEGNIYYVKDYSFKIDKELDGAFIAENDVLDFQPVYIQGSLPELYYHTITEPMYVQAAGTQTFTEEKNKKKTYCAYKLLNLEKMESFLENFYFYPKFSGPSNAQLCQVSPNWKDAKCGKK